MTKVVKGVSHPSQDTSSARVTRLEKSQHANLVKAFSGQGERRGPQKERERERVCGLRIGLQGRTKHNNLTQGEDGTQHKEEDA